MSKANLAKFVYNNSHIDFHMRPKVGRYLKNRYARNSFTQRDTMTETGRYKDIFDEIEVTDVNLMIK
jgi:hypothetical protein